jgi:hypothetical protein
LYKPFTGFLDTTEHKFGLADEASAQR